MNALPLVSMPGAGPVRARVHPQDPLVDRHGARRRMAHRDDPSCPGPALPQRDIDGRADAGAGSIKQKADDSIDAVRDKLEDAAETPHPSGRRSE